MAQAQVPPAPPKSSSVLAPDSDEEATSTTAPRGPRLRSMGPLVVAESETDSESE